ncbi:unnamed protein product [Bursaphelenchus xylophilus]|uniref:(pine wood nematode) hypothetical protein n=1 Tax=Bursaphelenchus xylophilus TaxID=6326 RepID=A0A1I7RQC4_BURXY|nr:unnamed protein product [Bursaphelenchus xylophilus]CAG9104356.1 unnamed protein product [Bursaphelenchus xylophilus]
MRHYIKLGCGVLATIPLLIVLHVIRKYAEDSYPAECECNGENFCFPGVDENLRRKFGRPFPCDHYRYLKRFDLTEAESRTAPNAIEEINEDWQPVFVSGCSEDHFREMVGLVKNIRQRIQNPRIIVYDLGLNSTQIEEVKSWCNVEYRFFVFEQYPEHFRNLRNYAFKAIIAEVLQTEKNFFYYDSSVRLKNDAHKIIPEAVKAGRSPPFMNYNAAPHSVYAVTQEGMYDYLPLPHQIVLAKEYQSLLFVSDSPFTRRAIKWFMLCALTEDCISPPAASPYCYLSSTTDWINNRLGENCHRFDQNVWNFIHLSYLFDPIRRGAQALELVDEWGSGPDFVKKVKKARDRRFIRLGKTFSVIRCDFGNDSFSLTC